MSGLNLLISQDIYIVDSFTLECGTTLRSVPVAYKTWGTLNGSRDNVMIICHAFTGSADVEDWWGPLMGQGKAFDSNTFFIFCANVLGSPYGTASPITINPSTSQPYGPEFPPTTIRDDIRLHKLVLDSLHVSSVAVVIGGSMGGMAVLEWPLCAPKSYVKHVVPIATSARHSAWCISWGEAQRQSIYSDPVYDNGYYYRNGSNVQPAQGLAAARMTALLTYRSRDSFESRFGRTSQKSGITTPAVELGISTHDALAAHNEGQSSHLNVNVKDHMTLHSNPHMSIFSAQSYLRYQGSKFTARFDANCYIHITRKLDTHDLSRPRSPADSPKTLDETLALLPKGALVIGVQSDGLFTISEQHEIARSIPDAEMAIIQSPDGHDGFLLEFEQINAHVLKFLQREFPQFYEATKAKLGDQLSQNKDFEVKKTSLFGEAEADVTRW